MMYCSAAEAFQESVPRLSLVLLHSAYIEYVESSIEKCVATNSTNTGQLPDEAGGTDDENEQQEQLDPAETDSPVVIWDSNQKGGLSMQAQALVNASNTDLTVEKLMVQSPESGAYRKSTIKGNKNNALPAGVLSITLKEGTLGCAEVFNAVHAHGGAKVCDRVLQTPYWPPRHNHSSNQHGVALLHFCVNIFLFRLQNSNFLCSRV
jgi:hypothetical protein